MFPNFDKPESGFERYHKKIMGSASEMAIAEANRNEALEALAVIKDVRAEIGTEIMNLPVGDDSEGALISWNNRLREAMKLVEKFAEKHQPEIQSWK